MKKSLPSDANKADPRLRRAVGEIIHRISAHLPELQEPIRMYLAGGMAVHFFTGYRSTVDIDASFSHRLLLPKAEDLVVAYKGADGKPRMVYFDMNYNVSFALTHPDFEKAALRVEGPDSSIQRSTCISYSRLWTWLLTKFRDLKETTGKILKS